MLGCSTGFSLIIIIFYVSVSIIRGQNRCSQINYEAHASNGACSDIEFCSKTFNISYIQMLPYAPSGGVQEFLRICCQNCTKFSVVNTFKNISEVNPISVSTSHFVYPFLGSVTDTLVNGYYFIPVLHVPKAYYMTARTEVSLFLSLFDLLPLVIICLLMAAVAGFVCWIAETRSNTEEFPKSFIEGWFQGFWWSVISMTTVGYGDKTPKTVLGRLFGIIWIIVGICSCAIVTAMLTTTAMDANNPKIPSMNGARVGVLKHRLYDALLVSSNGGVYYEAESPEFNSSIYEMVHKVKDKKQEIDGMILDSYTLWYVLKHLRGGSLLCKSKEKETENIMKNMVLTDVQYDHEVLAYGILVKYKEDYEFLNDVIRSNRFVLQRELHHRCKKVHEEFFRRPAPGLFDSGSPRFQVTLLSLVALIVFIGVFGSLYECGTRKKKIWSNLFSRTCEKDACLEM